MYNGADYAVKLNFFNGLWEIITSLNHDCGGGGGGVCSLFLRQLKNAAGKRKRPEF